MEDAKIPGTSKISAGSVPELKVVEIASRPGPDGEDRLRRLFTLLVSLASADQAPPLRK